MSFSKRCRWRKFAVKYGRLAMTVSKSRRSLWAKIRPPCLLNSAREIRNTIAGEALEFVGLHWLLAAPPGLQISTNDARYCERSVGIT